MFFISQWAQVKQSSLGRVPHKGYRLLVLPSPQAVTVHHLRWLQRMLPLGIVLLLLLQTDQFFKRYQVEVFGMGSLSQQLLLRVLLVNILESVFLFWLNLLYLLLGFWLRCLHFCLSLQLSGFLFLLLLLRFLGFFLAGKEVAVKFIFAR